MQPVVVVESDSAHLEQVAQRVLVAPEQQRQLLLALREELFLQMQLSTRDPVEAVRGTKLEALLMLQVALVGQA